MTALVLQRSALHGAKYFHSVLRADRRGDARWLALEISLLSCALNLH